MKRVYCLYRVSTKKQVDKDKNDIPMQKEACHEFAKTKEDWAICKEYAEKGVSGFKVSANDRDAIQELKAAALKREFDILLVFMFDRIGRIDDETPFVVEWFAKNGIEVWSTQEGQQRFDTHVDKLMNYLRFWQASGESQKTSIRIKTKMQQMVADGFYTGGPIKYGYHLKDSGHINRKGHPIRSYEIDEAEAEIIHIIDDMTINRGYGSWRMADYLNKKGYQLHTGNPFTSTAINRILKDVFYCGCLPDGTSSPALEKLAIRTPETFARIQSVLLQRSAKNEEKRHIALQTKGKAMLSGNVFCAHCGGRLTTIRYKDHYTRKDGTEYAVDMIKYCCYHKSRKLCQCNGQTTYRADVVDEKISQVIQKLFEGIQGAPEEERLQKTLKRQLQSNRAMQKKLRMEQRKQQEQLSRLQLEIGKVLVGDSVYSEEDLSQAIRTLKERLANGNEKLSSLEQEEMERQENTDKIIPAYQQFQSWAEGFEQASLEQKKMIACQLFKRIEVGRGYTIDIEMNMTYQQFCSEWQSDNEVSLKSVI